MRNSLRLAGLDKDGVEQVVADAYAPVQVREQIRHSARHTVRLFESVGVLEMPGAEEAFAAAGLV